MRLHWIRSQCNESDKIVDIGSNKGHTFWGWAHPENVTSVDIDQYDIPNFVRASADNLPFEDNSFDVAVLAEVVEHVPNPIKVLKEAMRVAKRVIITIPNEYEWNKDNKPFFKVEDFEKDSGKKRQELAEEGNPATEFFEEDNLEHLYHHRWYTEETLDKDLKEAGMDGYTSFKLADSGFAWFCVTWKK